MTKTYLYFQPEYVNEFVCDGSKCGDNCCERSWSIVVDKATFEQYKQIQPADKAREITACFGYNADTGNYFVKDRPCPFLTDKKLCRLQLEYGESFLSETCVTYPRRTVSFGKFLERSVVMSCPLAAELILFRDEPIKFEFVEVSEQVHSRDGKLLISPVYSGQKFAAHMLDLQIAMISILQERTLTIDQRLVVLGFFMDKLDEIKTDDDDGLTKLIAAYESKKFLSEQAPRMTSSVHFNAKNFSALMVKIFESIYTDFDFGNSKKIFNTVAETFGIVLDANEQTSVENFAANYERFADERKNFLTRRSLLLENFLVNELFENCYPWRHQASVAKNFGFLAMTYKVFELMTFAAEQQNLADKTNLSLLTACFLSLIGHTGLFAKKIMEFIPDEIFDSMETLLDA